MAKQKPDARHCGLSRLLWVLETISLLHPLMISPCVIVGRQSKRPPLGGNKRQTRLMPRVKGFRQVTGRISVRVRKRLRERILPLRCLRAAMCRSGRTRPNISRVSQMRPG